MVHVYFKYLFFLFSIAVNNINVTPYPELDNKIAFLRIFYITTYKNQKSFDFRGSVQKFMMTLKKLRNNKTSSNRNQYEEFRGNSPKVA